MDYDLDYRSISRGHHHRRIVVDVVSVAAATVAIAGWV